MNLNKLIRTRIIIMVFGNTLDLIYILSRAKDERKKNGVCVECKFQKQFKFIQYIVGGMSHVHKLNRARMDFFSLSCTVDYYLKNT